MKDAVDHSADAKGRPHETCRSPDDFEAIRTSLTANQKKVLQEYSFISTMSKAARKRGDLGLEVLYKLA